MFRPLPVLSVSIVALATTVSLRAAAGPSPTLSEVLARAAHAIAALADSSHRIACEENARQTVVVDPVPVPLDWSHNLTPWLYRDVVASWSVTPPSTRGSEAWNEVRAPKPLEPFQPFPGKRTLDARTTAAIDQTIDVPAPLPRMAAVFLSAQNQPRFEFSKVGETEVQGVAVWEVSFRETATPPLWTLPVSGSVWIDPATGRVVRSAIAVKGEPPYTDAMRVEYRLDPATGFYLPHTLRRRTHITSERLWVETTGTFTGCRVSPVSTH